jgi:hypothetical protein
MRLEDHMYEMVGQGFDGGFVSRVQNQHELRGLNVGHFIVTKLDAALRLAIRDDEVT